MSSHGKLNLVCCRQQIALIFDFFRETQIKLSVFRRGKLIDNAPIQAMLLKELHGLLMSN